jgi:Response regulator of the LytR/AlgR family
MHYRALLVDDEAAAIKSLRELLKNHQSVIEVTGETDSTRQAVEKTNSLKPDLLFLDIQLTGMSAFPILKKFTCEPRIIFTTGYNQYTLKAFDYNALDYILKPVDPERLEKSVNRLTGEKKNISIKNTADKLRNEMASAPLARIQSKIGDTIYFANVEDVLYFEAEDYYCGVHTNNKKLLIRTSLLELEKRLPEGHFLRIHRKYVVNVKRIKQLQSSLRGNLNVILDVENETSLGVSRNYAPAVRRFFRYRAYA